MPHQAERALRVCEALIERARYVQGIAHPIGIAFDEWNVWYRARDPELRQTGIEEQYDLSDALALATFLNAFIRHCNSVEIANFAQMVNAIASLPASDAKMFVPLMACLIRLARTLTHPGQLNTSRVPILTARIPSPTLPVMSQSFD